MGCRWDWGQDRAPRLASVLDVFIICVSIPQCWLNSEMISRAQKNSNFFYLVYMCWLFGLLIKIAERIQIRNVVSKNQIRNMFAWKFDFKTIVEAVSLLWVDLQDKLNNKSDIFVLYSDNNLLYNGHRDLASYFALPSLSFTFIFPSHQTDRNRRVTEWSETIGCP
jgi:hypothetical protein